MSKRKSFLLHIDSLDILDDLTNEQVGELFRAIKAYQHGETLELSPIVKVAFSPFKNQFIRDSEKYEKTCKARAAAGSKSKGGKQKVANASKSQQKVANLADNKNKNKNKNKSDSDSDSNNKDLMSDKSDAITVLNYLNEVCSSKYKNTTKSHIENINARLAEGHTWANDKKMAGYLRPSTLFSTGKFQGYLTQAKTIHVDKSVNAIGNDFSKPKGWA
jgi:uncharacterized phage protein (TIGR02220 family)